MDNLGTEVSNKIRSAIKAKLIELDAYVDDELPDYIMVMVANDRNKEQMDDDLGLFLNENTLAFTTWLHNVLDKLRKVTLEEVAKKDVQEKKKKKKPKKEKESEKKKKVKKSKTEKPTDAPVVEKKSIKAAESEPRPKKVKEVSKEKEEPYDAEAILKKAVKSSAKSVKVNPVKKGTPTKKVKKSKVINLKEDQEFYKPNKTAKVKQRSLSRSRSRSFSMERKGSVASRVQVVNKKSSRQSRSGSTERRSVASKAILPPRPARPTGREERGVARVLSRSIKDADRSVTKKRVESPPLAYRRYRSLSRSRSPQTRRDDDKRQQSYSRQSQQSHSDRRKDKETRSRSSGRDSRKRIDKSKDDLKRKKREVDETKRLKREVDRLNFRQLAMDKELEKLGRVHDKESQKRKLTVESVDLVEEDEDEVRIIVRRDESEKVVVYENTPPLSSRLAPLATPSRLVQRESPPSEESHLSDKEW